MTRDLRDIASDFARLAAELADALEQAEIKDAPLDRAAQNLEVVVAAVERNPGIGARELYAGARAEAHTSLGHGISGTDISRAVAQALSDGLIERRGSKGQGYAHFRVPGPGTPSQAVPGRAGVAPPPTHRVTAPRSATEQRVEAASTTETPRVAEQDSRHGDTSPRHVITSSTRAQASPHHNRGRRENAQATEQSVPRGTRTENGGPKRNDATQAVPAHERPPHQQRIAENACQTPDGGHSRRGGAEAQNGGAPGSRASEHVASFAGGPCADPRRCRFWKRYAAGPWTCEACHPRESATAFERERP